MVVTFVPASPAPGGRLPRPAGGTLYLCQCAVHQHRQRFKARTESLTGKKPYTREMCTRRFTNKHHVAPHERTRTGEKLYGCSMCLRPGPAGCDLGVPFFLNVKRFNARGKVTPH